MIDHLRDDHRITVETSREAKRTRDEENSQKIFGSAGFQPTIRKTTVTGNTATISSSGMRTMHTGALRVHFLEWIARDNLPASITSSSAFRTFLQFINSTANDLLPRSSSTIRTDLKWAVDIRSAAIRDALAAANSKIHLICDAWTSPNGYAVWGVQASFLDNQYRKQELLIGLERLRKDHKGNTLALATLNVAEFFGILKKLGYLVMDNASSNDTLVETIESEMEERAVQWNAEQHRIRCFGHIVNLAAAAFIYQEVTDENLPAEDDDDEWLRFGCLGKLHNIIVYIQRSPQRRERFRDLAESLNLHRDNKTRWNSWYISIERACKPVVKQGLMTFCDEEQELRAERLSPEDWDTLIEIKAFLQPLHDTTKATEGVFHTIDRVLPGMEYLLEHLEISRRNYCEHGYLGTRVDAAWAKLDEYYSKSDVTIAYFAATALNPLYKWKWIERRWTTTPLKIACRNAKRRMKDLWLEEYKTIGLNEQKVDSSEAVTSDKPKYRGNSFYAWIQEDLTTGPEIDEFETYFSEQSIRNVPIKEFSALAWWSEDSQRRRYPRLSRMAFDLLTIPAMSASIERVFSECKLTCLRHATLPETLKDLHLLRSWLRSTVLEGVSLVNHLRFRSTVLIISSQIDCLTSFLAVRKPLKKPRTKLIVEIAEAAARSNHSVSNMRRAYETEYGHYRRKYCYAGGM